MADRTVLVKLTADASGVKSGMREASDATRSTQDAMKSAGDAAQQAGAQMNQASAQGKTGLAGLADSARQNGAAWTTVGTAVAGVGAGLLGFAGSAAKTAADFDAAMSSVQAATHASGDEMSQLREAAIQAGADTAFSATEAAAGIEELAKAGVSTSDILHGGLTGALDLAAAGEVSVAEAAETAATAMTQFGLGGDQVTHVADLLAAGAGKAQGGVHDLAFALKQSGLVASQMGLSIEDTTGALGAFASAGLIGSDAGTSFKTMLQRLQNPSTKAANAMKDIGLNVYDANGSFIGITATAQQLKDGLSGLSEEQRNQAMATIFGSDAIRAANVLYNEGGEGIQDWIDKVNDAGYAAETARLKQDNLKGDLEKLGGSWETAMIKIGASSEGPLRSVVQTITSVVDKLGDLSPGAQTAVLGITAVGGAALTAVGGMMVLAPKIVEIRDAMNTLGWTSGNAVAGIKNLATGTGAMARAGRMLAMGALIAGISEYGNKTSDAAVSVDEMASALKNGGSALDQLHFDTASKSADEFGVMLADISRPSTWAGLEMGTAHFLDGITAAFGADTRSEVQQLKDTLESTGKALASMSTDEATAQFKKLSNELTDGSRRSMIDLINDMPEFKAHLDAVANQMGLTADDSTRLALALGQIDPNANQSADSTDRLDQAIRKAKEGSDQAAPSIEEVVKAIHDFGEAAIGASNADIKYQEALKNVNDAIAENGQNLDITTEAGRKNQSALNDLASATLAQVQAGAAAGETQDALQTKMQTGRDAFIQAAEAMGMTEDEATQLADSYGLIPEKISTEVTADTQPALENADGAKAKIEGMTGYISVDGDTSKVDYSLAVTADSINGTTGYVEIDANNDRGLEGLQSTVQTIDNADGTVSILGDATGARWEKDTVKTQIDDTTGEVTISGKDEASGKLRTVKFNMDQIQSKTVSVTVKIKQFFEEYGRRLIANPFGFGIFADGGAVSAYADGGGVSRLAGGGRPGGAVYGPGGPREDRVPALLSHGEHVLTAAEVAALGGQQGAYRLRRMIREGIIGGATDPVRYADGGAITSGTAMLGLDSQVTPKMLRKALDGVNVELTVDGQTTLTSRMRTIADASTVTAYRMSR